MAEQQEQTQIETSTTTMAETEAQPLEPSQEIETTKKSLPSISFSIWPPSQRTRDAVINRLIETLSSTSVLSKRYGTLRHDEASDLAKQIEEEAFTAAGTSPSVTASGDDGIEILQVYSKEISKRMLDSVKSRSGSPATTAASTPSGPAVEEEEEKKKDSDEPTVEETAGDVPAKNEDDPAKDED